MISLESVRVLLVNYLAETSHRDGLFRTSILINKRDFSLNVYQAFFNLVADPDHTPEYILSQLETYISGLDGFSTDKAIQIIMAFACFESLAKRKFVKLTGSWEKLSWFIIRYASLSKYEHMYKRLFKISSPLTVNWIQKFSSPLFCPNPCLRLELYKLMRKIYCSLFPDPESFRENVILTLLELSDNYEKLTVEQLPYFRPVDLKSLIKDNNISMEYLLYNDLNMRKTEIIAAVLKLTKMLALVVKQTFTGCINDVTYEKLYPCFTFCGLVPISPDMDLDCELIYLVDTVNNYPLLMKYIIETLETIEEVSLCFYLEDDLMEKVKGMNRRILNMFYKSHINKVPNHLYLQEINGGNNPAMKYQLEYLQNNKIDDDNDLHYFDYKEYDY